MRASENRRLHRTYGDTDPLLVYLTVKEDGGTTPVPDSATVEIHIATDPVTTIAAVPRGDDLGYFSFPTTTIAAVAVDGLSFEIQVTDGAVEYTIARGTLVESTQIA